MDRARPGSLKYRIARVLSLGSAPSDSPAKQNKYRPRSESGLPLEVGCLPSPTRSAMTSPNTSPQNKPAPTSSLPLGKWQLMIRETTVPSHQLVAWTRVWRLARLLLDTGC